MAAGIDHRHVLDRYQQPANHDETLDPGIAHRFRTHIYLHNKGGIGARMWRTGDESDEIGKHGMLER